MGTPYSNQSIDVGATSPFGTALLDQGVPIPEQDENEPVGMSEEEVQSAVETALNDAVSFIDSEIGPQREAMTRQYNGEPYGDEEEGRSQVVTLDIHDTVSALMPDLMRIFFGPEKVCEFTPTGPEDAPMAEQATDYVEHIIKKDNPGFLVLYSAFKDALVRKTGIVKWWWDESSEPQVENYSGLSEEAVAMLMAELGDEAQNLTLNQDPETGLYYGELKRMKRLGKVRIASVPPEELLINRRARTIQDAQLVAHRARVTISDLVSMGYDEEEIEDASDAMTSLETNIEALARQPYLGGTVLAAEHNREVLYTETYIKLDVDGDGISELRRICTVGDRHKVLRNETAPGVNMTVFCPEPEPHEFFGTSIADITADVQRVKTRAIRGILDSMSSTLHPRTTVVEGQVNLDDALNTEVGAIIRQKAAGMVGVLQTPFVGRDVLPIIDLYDGIKQDRTGVSKAAAGLDADALQSTTKAAVAATVTAAHRRVELIARIFAETGMKDLFRGILHLVVNNQQQERIIKLRNQWVPMNPASWRADMDVTVDVAVGSGTLEERQQALDRIVQKQEQILQFLGPNNPLVTLRQYRDTMAKMIVGAGFKDPGQFFLQVTDESLQAYAAQQQQQGVGGDPQNQAATLLASVQAEEIKSNISIKSAELELKRHESELNNQREWEKMRLDYELKLRELELKYGAAAADKGMTPPEGEGNGTGPTA